MDTSEPNISLCRLDQLSVVSLALAALGVPATHRNRSPRAVVQVWSRYSCLPAFLSHLLFCGKDIQEKDKYRGARDGRSRVGFRNAGDLRPGRAQRLYKGSAGQIL